MLFKKTQRVKFKYKNAFKDGQICEDIGFVQDHCENGQLEIMTADGQTYVVDSYDVETT
jgi:hypothetical protein